MLREAPNLTRLVVTPLGTLQALDVLDLTACPRLGYLFLQCPSLHTLLLDGCTALTKAPAAATRSLMLCTDAKLETNSAFCAHQQTFAVWADVRSLGQSSCAAATASGIGSRGGYWLPASLLACMPCWHACA